MVDGSGVPTGTPLTDPPLIEMISEDPVLRSCKLIAEAWDCDGLNQVGAFPHYGGQWAEWNGHFRDTVRQFIKVSHPRSCMQCGSRCSRHEAQLLLSSCTCSVKHMRPAVLYLGPQHASDTTRSQCALLLRLISEHFVPGGGSLCFRL